MTGNQTAISSLAPVAAVVWPAAPLDSRRPSQHRESSGRNHRSGACKLVGTRPTARYRPGHRGPDQHLDPGTLTTAPHPRSDDLDDTHHAAVLVVEDVAEVDGAPGLGVRRKRGR